MSGNLVNAEVVLAAIDNVLAVDRRSPAWRSIVEYRLKRLRAQVAEYVTESTDSEPPQSGGNPPYGVDSSLYVD